MTALWGEEFVMESEPTPEQKVRLGDFLSELLAVSRKYGMLIDAYGEEGKPAVIDLAMGGRIVGLELSYFVSPDDQQTITGYDFLAASILDGIWMVDTPDGPTEQRYVDGSDELARRQILRRRRMVEARR